MSKRIADIVEKLGVAGLALGIYQGNVYGACVGMVLLLYCLYLTRRLEQ